MSNSTGESLAWRLGLANVSDSLEEEDWPVLGEKGEHNQSRCQANGYPMLENLVKGSNNSGPIPPVRRIDSFGTDTTACSTSTLDFDNRSETACREDHLEL
jgi:hypothetical protein